MFWSSSLESNIHSHSGAVQKNGNAKNHQYFLPGINSNHRLSFWELSEDYSWFWFWVFSHTHTQNVNFLIYVFASEKTKQATPLLRGLALLLFPSIFIGKIINHKT